MRLDLGGHPIHTRALCVEVALGEDGKLAATADLVDLRKRGFVPVGSELQGSGIIHQMGVDAVFDLATLTLESIEARQPVVAFEASRATRGESCRDVVGRLSALPGLRLDQRSSERLRETIGGPVGCSHILTAAQLLCSTLSWLGANGDLDLDPLLWSASTYRRLFRRDLVFDACELEEGRMGIGVQLGDVRLAAAPPNVLPMARFASHFELRLGIELSGWPATISDISGAQRRRSREHFDAASWEDHADLLAGVRGMSLAKGATRELHRLLGSSPPLLDAMLMLGPALVQCRASFPDKWLNLASTTPGHPGLIAMPDSCYMWRRGGALEKLRGSGGE